MTSDNEIIFTEHTAHTGKIGEILLNRPNALNALSHHMCLEIETALTRWTTDPSICAVWIKGAGDRAFCAGGDIRALYHRTTQDPTPALHFFEDEYRMNRCLYHFPKPYIAFLDGITMGGGAGVSCHGSHTLGTERLKFAMPETGIGFFPDIGAMHFLHQCRGKVGLYLAMTGAVLDADTTCALGLITHRVASTDLAAIEDALLSHPIHSRADVDAILASFALKDVANFLLAQLDCIEHCFNEQTVEAILAALTQEKASSEFATQTHEKLLACSPTSVKVAFAHYHGTQDASFDEIIERDYTIACHFMRGHDFKEGIRAKLVEKDNAPQWTPNTFEAVDNKDIENYFAPYAK